MTQGSVAYPCPKKTSVLFLFDLFVGVLALVGLLKSLHIVIAQDYSCVYKSDMDLLFF